MQTITLSPADTIALAPAAGGIATAVRRLAGSAFRPHSWPTDARAATLAAAAFVARVGFPADFLPAGRCSIGTTPRSLASDVVNVSLPSRLIIVAVAVADAERASPQPYLDRAFDLLAGLCLCNGQRRATLLGAVSMHGFGFTMSRIDRATERKLCALFAIDRRNVTVREGFVTRPQRSLHDGALRVLAAQWEAEAADPTLPPLDRARRVAAAARIAGARFPAFGSDECGEALALYAEVASTDDGSEAWARFASASERANPAEPRGEPNEETMRRADEDADNARAVDEKVSQANGEDGAPIDADAYAEEARGEAAQRRARASAAAKAPKGRSKAAQAATEATEAASLISAAAPATEVASRTEGGVDTTASRNRHRAVHGVILAD